MSILRCFPFASMAVRPFADYLNVTVPYDHAASVRDALLPLVDSLGSFEEVDDGLFQFVDFRFGSKGRLEAHKAGTLKMKRRGQVLVVSVSGAVLSRMRLKGLYAEYLSILSSFPHRVSMLHATADYFVPSAPSVVAQVKAAASAGGLALTRKHLQPSQCRYVLGTDCDGFETGTAYLGQKANADVWAKVYDKRHERISQGYADPGSLVRVEVAIQSGAGATLRDAFDPSDVFFQFAGRSLVEVPPEFPGWLPHGEGFILGERRERTLFERFEALLEGSRDIRRLADLAVQLYGDMAAQVLGRKVIALVSGKPLAISVASS